MKNATLTVKNTIFPDIEKTLLKLVFSLWYGISIFDVCGSD